ncbi:unnamed protein product [Adineta steineri]|uniref:Sacsin/Nov domain-containing protein n=1 Tax=Adineta steineri TaxID=433720 RepID=A0A815STE6_9BILA|nr:unnamed protein product [Adineta steineri]CAF1471580.1 unnamed protein product [Adineta steineri]CAF1495034.1 unnamed protein product [Adineta steineri]
MSNTIQRPISSDALRQKAQNDGVEQRVEVNQRMLIDKMLARYSSDFVVCRELIQNSDDAQAKSFHFEITCDTPMNASDVQQSTTEQTNTNNSTDIAINFHNSTITEIRTVNNGLIFNTTDWKRVSAIAEGNTNVDSVGQFGVGFFSVFQFSEEPIITSGNEYMTFVWRDDNSLTTFRHTLPVEQQSKLTSIILKMRSKYILQTETKAIENKEHKHNIKSAKRTKKEPTVKDIIPTIDLTQLKAYFIKVLSFTKYVEELIIKINGFIIFQVNKVKKVIPPISRGLPFKKQSSISKMLSLETFVQTEQTFNIKNGASMTLNHISVNARVMIDEDFHNHIRRIMKKSLPSNIQIQLLFAPNSLIASQQSQISIQNSDHHTKLLNSLIPLKFENDSIIPSGFVFIGLGTHQTTGIGMHVYSHLIPTIERENIDLQDPYIAKWNKELLASTGQISRLIYDQAMVSNSNASQKMIYNYEFILGPYSFQTSVPNNEIGETIIDGFFSSDKDILVPVRQKPSDDYLIVLPSTKAFLTNTKQIHEFLSLPLVPYQLITNGLIQTLIKRTMIDYVDKSMVERTLTTSTLSIPEFVNLVQWLFSNDVADPLYAKRILSNVRFFDHIHSLVISFGSIQYYDSLNIPLSIPLPVNSLPRHVSSLFSVEQLEKKLLLLPLKIKDVLNIYFADSQVYLLQDPKTSPSLLSVISRYSGQLTQEDWSKIKTKLSKIECIPTTQGMKIPSQSFIPSSLVSSELPAIILNIPQTATDGQDKILNESSENPVSANFLKQIGCRMLDLNAFDDDDENDQTVSSNSQATKLFVQHLMKERKNMSEADFNALKQKESLKGTTLAPTKETTRKYIPKDLHFPSVASRLQWFTLPIIDWPDINPRSAEYSFLKEIGVREVPELEKLIDRIIQEHNDMKQEDRTKRKYKIPLSLEFFVENFQQYYCNSWKTDSARKRCFLPSRLPKKINDQNNDDNYNYDVILSTPEYVFGVENPLCATLIHEVIKLFEKSFNIALLGIKDHPNLLQAFDILMKNKDELLTIQSAPKIFAYLNGLDGLNRTFIERISKLAFIPMQGSNILMKPSQVFVRSNVTTSQSTVKNSDPEISDIVRIGLIDYVDFGLDANEFLRNIGVCDHPKPSVLAELLIDRQATYFASTRNNKNDLKNKVKVYIDCLKQLASAAMYSQELQSKSLQERLRTNAWCLAFENTDGEINHNDFKMKIVKPNEVYLDDDHLCAMAFRPLLPPSEPALVKLYEYFGAKWLSDCVKRTMTFTGRSIASKRATELRDLIQNRLPMLFVNNRGEKLPYLNEVHVELLRTKFSIYEVDEIQCQLTFKGKRILIDSENSRSCVLTYESNKVTLYFGKYLAEFDYYDIASELVAYSFSEPANYIHEIRDKLESSLETLKRRGIPVDRLLQNTHKEPTEIIQSQEEQQPKPQQPKQQHGFLENLSVVLPFLRKRNRNSISIVTDKHESENLNERTTTDTIHDHKTNAATNSSDVTIKFTTNQKNENGPVIGVGGNYTVRSQSNTKPITNFRHAIEDEENLMKKIHQGQSYNRSRFVQSECTKTEICTMCGYYPAANMIRFPDVLHSIPLYVEKDVSVSKTMIDQAKQLAYLLNGLATNVFKISIKTVHLFRDINGRNYQNINILLFTIEYFYCLAYIAFNQSGAIFFNLRYFEDVYADELKPHLRTSTSSSIIYTVVNFYFLVFCHELAHNIAKQHDDYFVSWLEKIVLKFMTEKDFFLQKFSFENY